MGNRRNCIAGLAAIGTLSLFAAGCRCATPAACRISTTPQVASGPHALIFNPGDSETPVVHHQSEWPTTIVSDRGLEVTEFVETTRDWQGTFWDDRDRYQRRFYSTRSGTTRR